MTDPPTTRSSARWTFLHTPVVVAFAVVLSAALGALLEVHRAGPTAPRTERPPEARAYAERQVTFHNGDIRLTGTLTLPPGPGPFPAIFLITGSGAQDRDGEMFGKPRHKILAEALTNAGLVVLRADDRGVGGSAGDLSLATQADLAADAWAAVRFLRAQAEVDPERVGLYGASQGSTVAPLAAVEHSEVAFVVLVACVAKPFREVFLSQHLLRARALGIPEETVREIGDRVEEAAEVMTSTSPDEERKARLRPLAEEIESLMRTDPMAALSPFGSSVERMVASGLTPAMRDLLSYDPAPILERLRTPALVLSGDRDLQVDASSNSQLARELLERSGNPDFEVVVLPGLNHFLQPAETGLPDEYPDIQVAYAPEALEQITGWIGRRFVEPARRTER